MYLNIKTNTQEQNDACSSIHASFHSTQPNAKIFGGQISYTKSHNANFVSVCVDPKRFLPFVEVQI
jgi:hypothetical protein